MKALYIKGMISSKELEEQLMDSLIETQTASSVIDAIGFIKASNVDVVFLDEKTMDIDFVTAKTMISKLVPVESIYTVSANGKVVNGNNDPLQSDFFEDHSFSESVNVSLDRIVQFSKGDQSFVDGILQTIQEDFPLYVEQFLHLKKNFSMKDVGELAHKIKGPINMIGVNSLNEIIRRLDDMGKNAKNPSDETKEAILRDVDKIVQILSNSLIEINKLRAKAI